MHVHQRSSSGYRPAWRHRLDGQGQGRIQDADEPGINGAKVILKDADGEDYVKADFGVAEVFHKTGMDAAALALLGLALLAAGAVAILFGRRRRDNM